MSQWREKKTHPCPCKHGIALHGAPLFTLIENTKSNTHSWLLIINIWPIFCIYTQQMRVDILAESKITNFSWHTVFFLIIILLFLSLALNANPIAITWRWFTFKGVWPRVEISVLINQSAVCAVHISRSLLQAAPSITCNTLHVFLIYLPFTSLTLLRIADRKRQVSGRGYVLSIYISTPRK